MACEPFDCDKCGQRHDRCADDVVECPNADCKWSGGNTWPGDPCVKCGTPCIIRPCQKWPLKFLSNCQAHGASNAQSHAASQRKGEEIKLAKLLNIQGNVDPVVDPYSALSLIAGEILLVKDRLAERVEQLPSLEDAGTEKYAAQLAVTAQAYERFLTHSSKLLTDMSRLDLDARIAKLAAAIDSATAELVGAALLGALDLLELDASQRESVMREFGARLRKREDLAADEVPQIATIAV